VLLALPRAADAQYSVPSEAAGSIDRVGSARSKIQDEELVRKPGWEAGASLNFLMSDPSLGGRDLAFTDVVLLRMHGLYAAGGLVEIFGGIDILPKQPSYTDELIWQGGLVGVRYKVGKKSALWMRGQGGPELGGDGWWVGGDTAFQYKLALEEVLFWESALGGGYTQLFPDDTDEAYWVAEVMAQTGIAIRDPEGHFGAWLSFGFHFPVLDEPDRKDVPAGVSFLNSQTRVSFQLGGLIALSEAVDLFIEWSILDRGDLEESATILPMLNGGFDQQQLLFGFMRRFGGGTERRPRELAAK
jgi:hypothetical protein